MTRSLVLLVSLLAASLPGCCTIRCGPQAAGTSATALGGIIGTVERLIDADNTRDLEAVLSCYTDDVVWLPPGDAPVQGKLAVSARYESLFAACVIQLTLEITEASADGRTGFAWGTTRGTITPVGGGAAIPVDDKFLAVLREEDGHWRVARLAWSPSGHAP